MKRTHWILIGLLATLAVVGLGCSRVTGPVPFNEAAWKAGENVPFDSSAPRLRMADGLVESRSLNGKHKSEVLAMLGPPTDTDKFQNYALVYWLGAERGFISIDSEWLVVTFDKNNRVSEFHLVRD